MAFNLNFALICLVNPSSQKFLSGVDLLVKKLRSIMNHFLVPIHEIVPEEESSEVIKKYGGKKEKFPQILLSDPVMEELEAKKGDLIRIIRESPTAGKTVYYRVAVK